MTALAPYLSPLVGLALIMWGLVLAYQFVRSRLPSVAVREAVPVDDVRIVSDLATRLRSQGKTDAVKIALQLHAELLKPEAVA